MIWSVADDWQRVSSGRCTLQIDFTKRFAESSEKSTDLCFSAKTAGFGESDGLLDKYAPATHQTSQACICDTYSHSVNMALYPRHNGAKPFPIAVLLSIVST
jgi:hypothetical protein